MAELVRRYSPRSKIAIGNYGTAIEGIENMIDCDYIVRGEGIRWLREYLGEDTSRSICHPTLCTSTRRRIYGIPITEKSGLIITGLGCPNGCSFCCTSHFFQKNYIPFIHSGEELFRLCQRVSLELNTDEFSLLDENFLKQKERALELLSVMERERTFYTFSIFSSAETIKDFGLENMLRLGINLVWMGVESKKPLFEKTRSIDTSNLITELRNAGILVLTSAIIGLDHHDNKTIEEDIDYVISLKPDATQFMLFMAMPSTTLYEEIKACNLIDFNLPYEDWHGQKYLNWHHPKLSRDEARYWLEEAFKREYDELGASLIRIFRTVLNGYRYLAGRESDPLLALRRNKMRRMCKSFRKLLPTMKRFAHNEAECRQVNELEKEYNDIFGRTDWSTKITGRLAEAIALSYALRLKIKPDITQPRTICARYRWR